MEIILKRDVQNLGFKDDIVVVKNGYGRNFLIPQGAAILATPSAKKVLAENLKQRAFKEKKIIDDARELGKKLQQLEVKVIARVGAAGKLFGSVNHDDIAQEFEKAGFSVEKKYITIAGGSVKRVGKYEANVRLHREVIIAVPFEVVAEKED